MLYLSDILHRPLHDPQGTALARVQDVVVRLPADDTAHPTLHGLVVRSRQGKEDGFVSVAQVARVAPGRITLTAPQLALKPFTRRPGTVLLAHDVWDHRVIDCYTRQVRRVNDLALGMVGARADTPLPPEGYAAADLVLLGADTSLGGILRRLGLYRPLAGLLGRRLRLVLLPWDRMELFGGSTNGVARHDRLRDLHPVELAHLTENVSYQEAAEMIATLDDAVAADVLEELPADRQMDIVEYLPDTRTAAILEAMAPDDATDLLGDLPDARANALLQHMAPKAVAAVRTLLRYPGATAGGMMTTSYVRVDASMTVAETIDRLREEIATPDMVYYIYVTPAVDDDHLVGIVTLRELLLSQSTAVVNDIMRREFMAADPYTPDREVARRMGEYNLMALPVVDNAGRLLGIVTVDDALDVLLPAGWQRRLPRIFS